MSFIETKGLWQVFGSQAVLTNINLSIEKCSFVTIVGASGCGKTTFLRLLLGVETPSQGQLLIDSKPILPEPSPERGIVFQRYSVFPHLNVLQNIMLVKEFEDGGLLAKLWGKKRQQAYVDALDILEAVGLGASLDKYPAQLSGGMQQRLALAQSLIKQPKLLLLDEPFGALDPGTRADMHQLVLRLWEKYRFTIVMVTHDIKEAFSLGTRVLVFDKPHTWSDDKRVVPKVDQQGACITYDLSLKRTMNADREKVLEANEHLHI